MHIWCVLGTARRPQGRGGRSWDALRELKAAVGLMVEAPCKACCELYLVTQEYLREKKRWREL